MAGAIAAGVVIMLAPICIPILHKLKFGQSIREEGPKSHQVKSGTPTMGGIFLITGIVAATLIIAEWNAEIFLALFILLGHFILGFIDDYLKVVHKKNQGLLARYKLAGQILIAGVTTAVANSLLTDFEPTIWLPVLDEKIFAGVLYLPFMFFVMVGASNAVNLTDGLDGLASGCMAIAASCYAVICLLTGHEELAIFCAATVGACIGFLKFNFHPAKVFMGDTGSLALGGAFAAVGILSRTEILLAVVGFVFVCEALSVILQVISFQTTGKRIFRMSPLHHHFELGGWSEVKVVFVFWTVGLIFGVIGLTLLQGA
ncbi:MAG: phospho-N-acetylmuramoyl-pentapeptide-transferase [Selenomonadaceae bacterium]|nr:phospho-N-acetylmuramoyl-pentapeptide-transferase [Selenomonadaceae bacterium]MBQ3726945.1 phospho-N-acetylmuramoyl-pentapeptide-transferase [Selenomonadaceae bacterium]